ncbi:OsmC family protein [Xenophilus aerolatus]|nr:OsmC family protein [Xenophilus aerolatus]
MPSMPSVAEALARVEAVLRRRPEAGIDADLPATARWDGGLHTRIAHPHGHLLETDMPTELGGGATQPTPGWLLRASVAACTATRIAMEAARAGITLDTLEVSTASRSDARGLLDLPGDDGGPVSPAPFDLHMAVRIAARGVPARRLERLAAAGCEGSPMARALRDALPLAVHVEVLEQP